MSSSELPVLKFVLTNYKNFNARATRDALLSYWEHVSNGGRMFWSVAGAMSSAQLGITLAPAIREGLIHGLSVTGANIEESLFRLVAHTGYKDFPEYRYFTKQDDTRILEARMRRVTDTSIPEDEAFRAVEKIAVPMWKGATEKGERRFWHEYFYAFIQALDPSAYEGDPEACWLLEAARHRLPIVVPGYEDSTFGNIFASYVKAGECNASIVKSGIEYMADFYDRYEEMSEGQGVGFFQIGGGIAGDFPICVVPSIKYDLQKPVKPWAYFCQISDSTTSYGSYSGATPNEKITWDKLTETTPMFVIESDATIVAPLILSALLECKRNPEAANALIAKHQR
ncbi:MULTISPECIES: deoxyhypusine synthase family protein [Myxococcus]|uniref:Deoxyhypusine synthase n=1 Tax=Myxococcus xanthus TaxID=34 RepID=A0AAE6KRD1_MYXXA|nr:MULTISPECIES: deoxyhypusine synthase family protein [Myxococcus]QDE67026.1 deoxyhypusine synthase [Myxococcus xanthus]QDE74299.1 deoxyhypusine synthase [Myxococcus xanthus]QDE81564.1 deoxyhypusine synthase [Myxococcus xanthus]QDE95893.1 deoxyhypusine synthase [Myxococcus xanthus]QDF03215.1 deoxyhypusine synthase [Myxococcus xanthus]